MTRPILPELRRNQVTTFGEHSIVPPWKESAAETGRGFVVTKVFRDVRHPSGSRMGPGIKWFAGEPADSVSGMVSMFEPGFIWLSAKMASWREIVTAAAHETVHSYSYMEAEHYHEHELPTLVGKLAGAHWACEKEVFVKWGPLPDGWLPEGELELKRNAVVLHFENGDHCTAVNVANAGERRPRWEPRALSL